MNALHAFFGPTYDAILAGIRMGLPVDQQPRDEDTGRFISMRDITRGRLERLTAKLDDEQRRTAKARASIRQSSLGKHRGRE